MLTASLISIPIGSDINKPDKPTKIIDPINIRLVLFNLTPSFFIVLTPTKAIIENSIKLIPPITDCGIVLITAPNLAIKLSIMAKTAVNLKIDGL